MTALPSSSPHASDVRERILAAAREEFAARGLHAASVRTIGKGAGVTAAMINYYFRGKRALYEAVVAEAQGRLMARLSAALQGTSRKGAPARLAAAYFDFLAEEDRLQRLLLRELLDAGEGVGAVTDEFLRPLRALLEAHFGASDEAVQGAISLFGAVAGYFIYAPALEPFLGTNPLSAAAIAARREHVIELASMLEKRSRR